MMKAHLLVVAGIAGVFVSAAPGGATRRAVANRAAAPPVIDGRLDDACWQDAIVLDDFSPFARPEALHPETTVARVCFDDDNLYIALDCRVDEMPKFRARIEKAAGAFNYAYGGVVEVFLDTNRDRQTFQQYMLHANGSSKITLPRGDIFRILNEDHLESRSTIDDGGFVVEARFPLAMLHLHPDTAPTWGFNLNRAHDLYDERYDKNGFFSSWNSTEGAGFQSPERFGELVLDADLSPFYWGVAFVREPEPGDAAVALRVTNETPDPFVGTMQLSVVSSAGPATYSRRLDLAAGAGATVPFDHAVRSADAEAQWHVAISDASGRLRYLGGTEKKDLTPGDDWPPPGPTADEQRAGFLVFQRPYTQPVLYRAVPRREEVAAALSVAACRGEFEPVTVALHPLRDVAGLTVAVDDLAGPAGATIPASNVTTRVVQWQSRWANPRSFEALEHLLPTFSALDLIQARTRRLWLTLKVPDDAAPGAYRGTVHLRAGGVDTRLPLTLTVLPFELSRPEGMGYFMYYPGVKHPAFSTPDYFRKTVEDMRDHGMTTFTIYHWVQRKDPETGANRIDVDGIVSEKLGVTYAQMMAILGEVGLGAEAPLMDVHSMHYDPDLIVALDRVCRDRLWPDVLFYIEDEIDYPERIARARKTLEAIRAIAPDILTTTALGPKGGAALGHMYDVWIGCSSPEMIELCLSRQKAPWTYSCRAAYDVEPAFQRTFFGRFAWKLGLRGVGLWSYGEDDSFYDRLGRQHGYADVPALTPEWTHRYGHVYFAESGVVPTVTWEAVREGIDDYRYMLTLKRTAEAALADGPASARVDAEAALALLEAIAERTPIIADDKKYGRAWDQLGDIDAERARVVAAILKIRAAGG